MKKIKTEIEINAPVDKVWEVISNFNEWKEWNPIISNATGEAKLGTKLNIAMSDKEGKSSQKYQPVIIKLDEQKSFHWRAKMVSGHLFTNDKIVELKETETGTLVVHAETFSGLLTPLFWSKLNTGVAPMLDKMNKALKQKVE